MKYNWDLIERLLQHVQSSANERFNPRKYAVQLAEEEQRAGAGNIDEDELKAQACDYEALLLKAEFIAPRPEAEGGNGENFVLTDRGLQLLNMIDSSFPGEQPPREVLDREGLAALTPEIFDKIAVKAT